MNTLCHLKYKIQSKNKKRRSWCNKYLSNLINLIIAFDNIILSRIINPIAAEIKIVILETLL